MCMAGQPLNMSHSPRPGSPPGLRTIPGSNIQDGAINIDYWDDEDDAEQRRPRRIGRISTTAENSSPSLLSEPDTAATLHGAEQETEDLNHGAVWKLAILRQRSRRTFEDPPGLIRSRDKAEEDNMMAVSARPFIIRRAPKESALLQDTSTLRKRSSPEEEHVLEIVTQVFDSRYTLDDIERSAKPEDLQVTHVYGEKIKINSRHVCRALRALIRYYPDYDLDLSLGTVQFDEPYWPLMHYFNSIDDFVENKAQGEDAVEDMDDLAIRVKHMAVLRDFLKERFQSTVQPCVAGLREKIPTISFDMLWYLYHPGVLVYFQSQEGLMACIVKSVKATPNLREPGGYDRFFLELWCLQTDGVKIARIYQSGKLSYFEGTKAVTSLSVCPAQIWDAHDNGARRAKMMQLNERRIKGLREGSHHVVYDGPNLLDGHHVSTSSQCF